MAKILESVMLICFGLSWPFNIVKSIRSCTAKGKSIYFEIIIIIGYLAGLTGKFLTGNISYVVFFYIADIIMVSIDLCLTLRNIKLDKFAEERMRKTRTAE